MTVQLALTFYMQLSHEIFNTACSCLKLSKTELVLILLYGQLIQTEIKEEILQMHPSENLAELCIQECKNNESPFSMGQ